MTETQRENVAAVALDMWLYNEDTVKASQQEEFQQLKSSNLKAARAWALKEQFRGFWEYSSKGWAKRYFDAWYSWAIRSRLEPIKEKARMLKTHFTGWLSYFDHRISNAVAEGLNSKIQTVKANARWELAAWMSSWLEVAWHLQSRAFGKTR